LLLSILTSAAIGWLVTTAYNNYRSNEKDTTEEEFPISIFEHYPNEIDLQLDNHPTEDAVDLLFKTSKERLQIHHESIDNATKKANNLMKLNMTIIIVILGFGRLGQPEIFVSPFNPAIWPLYGGIVYLTAGTIYLLYKRKSDILIGGLGEDDILQGLNGEFTKPFLQEWALRTGFVKWIPKAREMAILKHEIIDISYWITTSGIILTVVGIIMIAIQN
jgi:hypothetical protein